MLAKLGLKKVYLKIVLSGLIWILLYKLFPYSFPLINSFSLESIVDEFSEDSLTYLKDYAELLISLLTFALLGFGLTGWLKNQGLKGLVSFLTILLVSISLSATTEVLQALSATRNPNVLDILTDIVGGVVGWFGFCQGRFQLFYCVSAAQRWGRYYLQSRRSLPTLTASFISYFLVAAVAMATVPTAADLSNWDTSLPLLLGNELTGNRPWSGRVQRVRIFDRALPAAEVEQLLDNGSEQPLGQGSSLLASYEFDQESSAYPDQTGQLPVLSWTSEPSGDIKGSGVSLSAAHWLQTSTSATLLNERIKQAAQLTLDVAIQPDNVKQRGPARILSLSKDALHRNLTLGQEGQNLVLRLRTPLTGDNGSNPEMVVPQVFSDSSLHHLVITYADSTARVYVDKLENLHTLKIPQLGYKVLYYGAIFVPLAGLLGLIFGLTQGFWAGRTALWATGVVLPALLLEGLLASSGHRNFSPENLFISLAFSIGTLLIVKEPIEAWLKATSTSGYLSTGR